jgi:hypothetical protein
VCPDPTDIAAATLGAFRPQDRALVAELRRIGELDPDLLIERIRIVERVVRKPLDKAEAWVEEQRRVAGRPAPASGDVDPASTDWPAASGGPRTQPREHGGERRVLAPRTSVRLRCGRDERPGRGSLVGNEERTVP